MPFARWLHKGESNSNEAADIKKLCASFLHLLSKHGKAGINCSASASTWQSVSAIDLKQKSTTDRYQRRLTPIRVRTRDTWSRSRVLSQFTLSCPHVNQTVLISSAALNEDKM